MNQTAETPASRVEPDDLRQQLAGKHACPFCGVIRADPQQPCARCTMEDTNATRGATRQRIGPWFVLQARNPSAPGMKFTTMLQLVRKGHVTPRSIVRGPTSQQLWTFAAKLRGLSREFGLCWHCGESVEPTSLTCGQCGYSQDLPANPDVLFEPPEATPPDIMEGTTLPRGDTGMDGGTSLDLQASDFTAPAAARTSSPASSALSAATSKGPTPGSPAASPVTSPGASPSPMPSLAPGFVPTPAVRQAPRPQSPAIPASLPGPLSPPLPARRPESAARQLSERQTVDRPPGGNQEGILTARELAAAFQLDFKPPNEGKARKGSLLRTIAALLLIAAVSATITLAIREDWRRTVFAAANEKWNGVKTALEQPSAKPTPNSTPNLAPNVSPGASPGASGKSSAKPSAKTPESDPQTWQMGEPGTVANPGVAVMPPPEVKFEPKTDARPDPTPAVVTPPAVVAVPSAPTATPTPTPVSTPVPTPEPIRPPAPAIAPPPAVAAAPTPTPVPPPVAPPVAASPKPAAPAVRVPTSAIDVSNFTPDQSEEKAGQWRMLALDAQGKGEWAAAVWWYEQIERLPRDYWPPDTELKLEIARKRAAN